MKQMRKRRVSPVLQHVKLILARLTSTWEHQFISSYSLLIQLLTTARGDGREAPSTRAPATTWEISMQFQALQHSLTQPGLLCHMGKDPADQTSVSLIFK